MDVDIVLGRAKYSWHIQELTPIDPLSVSRDNILDSLFITMNRLSSARSKMLGNGVLRFILNFIFYSHTYY